MPKDNTPDKRNTVFVKDIFYPSMKLFIRGKIRPKTSRSSLLPSRQLKTNANKIFASEWNVQNDKLVQFLEKEKNIKFENVYDNQYQSISIP